VIPDRLFFFGGDEMWMPSITRFSACICSIALATSALAQQGGPARVPRYIELMKNPVVRDNLQLLDVQVKDIEKIAANRNQLMMLAASEADRAESLEKRRELSATLQQNIAKAESAAADVLFPHQRERLVQIERQATIRSGDRFAGLTHPFLIDGLKISESQLKVIKQRAEDADARLQERLESLRKQEKEAKEEARRQVLSALSDDQRKQYADMMGDLVEIVQTAPLPATLQASKPGAKTK
jgi:hypothetical protein